MSPSQRPLPNNTQHSQETNIYAPGGIRTRNPSKRATADPRLRPRAATCVSTLLLIIVKNNYLHMRFLQYSVTNTDEKIFNDDFKEKSYLFTLFYTRQDLYGIYNAPHYRSIPVIWATCNFNNRWLQQWCIMIHPQPLLPPLLRIISLRLPA
jgi:hypothetical protein